MIGPNAILQLKEPVAALLGASVLGKVLDMSGVAMPSGLEMIPQEDVARVHHSLRRLFPDRMHDIADLSGKGTAQYICANRIPPLARKALAVVPTALGERLLTKAILAHAWTFCGSGSVTAQRRRGQIYFVLADNPLVDPSSDQPLQCDWHCAVFAQLYSALLGTAYKVHETECCGSGAPACRFVIQKT